MTYQPLMSKDEFFKRFNRQPARCWICGHFENEYMMKGMWVGGKWHCPRCIEQLAPQKPTDVAYRFECFHCEFYRKNMYGGLQLDGEPAIPLFTCFKWQAKERCVYDEPLKPIVKQPSTQGEDTITAIIAAAGGGSSPAAAQEPSTSRLMPVSLVGPASPLPERPHVESPAPDRKPPPRRQRRQA